jgi:hypothetical protein
MAAVAARIHGGPCMYPWRLLCARLGVDVGMHNVVNTALLWGAGALPWHRLICRVHLRN